MDGVGWFKIDGEHFRLSKNYPNKDYSTIQQLKSPRRKRENGLLLAIPTPATPNITVEVEWAWQYQPTGDGVQADEVTGTSTQRIDCTIDNFDDLNPSMYIATPFFKCPPMIFTTQQLNSFWFKETENKWDDKIYEYEHNSRGLITHLYYRLPLQLASHEQMTNHISPFPTDFGDF